MSQNYKKIIERAVAERLPLKGRLQLMRLFDGEGDGIAHLTLDLYGAVLLAHLICSEAARDAHIESALAESCADLAARWDLAAVYLRLHDKNPRSTANREAQLLYGNQVDSACVEEHGLNYIIKPEKNVNAGLFLDTRNLRKNLMEVSAGRKVMNCFCFTGSLGIAALAGGAEEVVQLDISKAVLGWAKENREANKRLAGNMRFICEDCRSFMEREKRRIANGARPYDLIVIDPPAFGMSGGKKFVFTQDVPELVSLAIEVLREGGELILCGNVSHVGIDELREIVYGCARMASRNAEEIDTILPPSEDFRANKSSVRGVWVRFR
jgi:23S rRNA (cytosine1962-C5)-methyltransferase